MLPTPTAALLSPTASRRTQPRWRSWQHRIAVPRKNMPGHRILPEWRNNLQYTYFKTHTAYPSRPTCRPCGKSWQHRIGLLSNERTCRVSSGMTQQSTLSFDVFFPSFSYSVGERIFLRLFCCSFFQFYYLKALQSDKVHVLEHKYVLGPCQGSF